MKSRIPRPRPPIFGVPLVAALALLAGCGGGGGGGGGGSEPNPTFPPAAITGKLLVDVAWPEDAGENRLVPTNALSIRIELLKDGAAFRSLLLAKPTAQASFDELPLGAIQVRATAYPAADGSGTALATTTVNATISADVPASVPLTMASTVAALEFSVSSLNLLAGATQAVTVTARNATGGAVLIDPASLSFASSAPASLGVVRNANGSATITWLAGVGARTITVTETGSGKTANLAVNVLTAISIAPTTTTLSITGQATFVPTVLGPANTGVTWSVQESGGGTITAGGVYTAPSARGTYHVVATSVADPTRTASATVAVRSGSGTVIVN